MRLSCWAMSHLRVRAVKVQVGAGRGGAALVLVAGAVDRRTIGMLRGGAGAEQAELADLHARPQLDGQGGDVGQLERHVPGESRIDPAARRVAQPPAPPEPDVS